MTTRLQLLTGALLVAMFTALAFACGGDDDAKSTDAPTATSKATSTATAGPTVDAADRKLLEDTATQVAKASGSDIDFFLAHVTDRVLGSVFGFSREDCRANAAACIGTPAETVTLTNTMIDGDRATTDGDFGSSSGETQLFRLSLVREGGQWKLDDVTPVAKEIPDGVEKVDLTMSEFKFTFDASKTSSGNFAFVIKNEGQQTHEVVLVKIPADADIAALIDAQAPPAGVETIAFQGPFSPGAEGTMVFDKPLTAGRYLLADFLPDVSDPAKTPHAKQGMTAEFTVQ